MVGSAKYELHQLMLRPGPRAFRLVDVRDLEDFRISHLEGAEPMPLSDMAADASAHLGAKDTPIVVYCRRGNTSQQAAEVLRHLGYEFVFQLEGGLEAWTAKIDPTFPFQEANESSQTADAGAAESVAPSNPETTWHAGVPQAFPFLHESRTEISPEELRDVMDRPGPRSFRLIDVREEDEFQICRLDWAELIPLAQVPEQAPRRLVDKDRAIVVYCHHGMRSQHACDWLRRAGYLHVFNLTGGIEAWADRVEPGMRRY